MKRISIIITFVMCGQLLVAAEGHICLCDDGTYHHAAALEDLDKPFYMVLIDYYLDVVYLMKEELPAACIDNAHEGLEAVFLEGFKGLQENSTPEERITVLAKTYANAVNTMSLQKKLPSNEFVERMITIAESVYELSRLCDVPAIPPEQFQQLYNEAMQIKKAQNIDNVTHGNEKLKPE